MTHTGYKANLLQNARFQMEQTGGKVIVRGSGNQSKVSFHRADGRSCVVWFPVESRVRDLEIEDLKEAIREMSGYDAFCLPLNQCNVVTYTNGRTGPCIRSKQHTGSHLTIQSRNLGQDPQVIPDRQA